MSQSITLFNAHQPSLLLEPDNQEVLPWAVANSPRLKADMRKMTDAAKKSQHSVNQIPRPPL